MKHEQIAMTLDNVMRLYSQFTPQITSSIEYKIRGYLNSQLASISIKDQLYREFKGIEDEEA